MTTADSTAVLDERGTALANELAAFIAGLPADEQDVMLAILDAASGADSEVEGFGATRMRVLAASVALAAAAGVGAAGSALSAGGSRPALGTASPSSVPVLVAEPPVPESSQAAVTPPAFDSASADEAPASAPPAAPRRPREPRRPATPQEPPVTTADTVVERQPEPERPDLGNDVVVAQPQNEETRYAPARSANTAAVTMQNGRVATQTSSTNTDAADPEIAFEVTAAPGRPGTVVLRATLRNTSDHVIRFGEINRLRIDVAHEGNTTYADLGEISHRVLRPGESLWLETTQFVSDGSYEFTGASLIAMH